MFTHTNEKKKKLFLASHRAKATVIVHTNENTGQRRNSIQTK